MTTTWTAEELMVDEIRATLVETGQPIPWGDGSPDFGTMTDEDAQFKGAVAAVYEASTSEDERDRIRAELESLRDLSALLSGVPVDLEQITPLENPIGLRKMWQEVTAS